MRRLLFLAATMATAAALAGLARPESAEAGWCWPDCNNYASLDYATTTRNGCWYTFGEICSGWNYWYLNGVAKICSIPCVTGDTTKGRILYGFENSQRIRGRFTYVAKVHHIWATDVGLGGMYLRSQVSWWYNPDGTPSEPSRINAAAAS